MKKRLLIVGGSHSDIPLIEAGKELGYYVITSGNNPNDLGHKYSDEVQLEDFSDNEAMLNLAKRLKIDAVCSGANDFAVISSSYIAEQLNLKGHDSYDTTVKLHHKDQFKKFAIQNNLLVPSSLSFNDEVVAISFIDNLKYPSIVKPIDLTGGKGIIKINNKDEAILAIKNAFKISKAKKIVIDDFVGGTLHSFSSIIRNKQVVFYFGDNEHSYLNKYLVSTSTSPSLNFDNIKSTLIEQTEKVANLLNLTDGILHMQYLLDGENINIIEFTRRMPGDLYYKPVEYSIGFNYSPYVLKASCGIDISDLKQPNQNGFYSRHCVMANQTGKIKNIIIDDSIQDNIIDEFMWWKKGDVINDFMTYKAGIIFLKYNSLEEMNAKNKIINELIKIEFK